MVLAVVCRSRWIRSLSDLALGALLTLAGVFVYQSNQEDYHFTRLVHAALGLPANHDNAAPHTDANALLIMHKVNTVMNGRYRQVADVGHPKPGVLWSSDEHLSEPSGACASYTQVLAKALQTAGYPIRKIGLSKNGQQGIHHVLETFIEGRWVLMDALSNLAFHRSDGRLASAAEVHADWENYRHQTAPGYNMDYDYSEFYYTNWNRIPVVGSVVKAFPSLHQWLEGHGVSIRFWVLDVNQWFAGLCAIGAALAATLRFWPKWYVWRSRRKNAPDRSSGSQQPGHRKGGPNSFTGAQPV
jgi:hypothetical protein